jgi:hypothetical protein
MNANKMNWRQRAQEEEKKKYAKTEENFPTLVSNARRIQVGPEGFANLANKWREDEELEKKMESYRKAKTARERREILATVKVFSRRSNVQEEDEEDDEEEVETSVVVDSPPHGRRGTYSEPDNEGWRLVTKRLKKEKRELTEAELAQKYREEFFGENGDEDDVDVNGDLVDRNQRRNFY